jgi:hypothetical protein
MAALYALCDGMPIICINSDTSLGDQIVHAVRRLYYVKYVPEAIRLPTGRGGASAEPTAEVAVTNGYG